MDRSRAAEDLYRGDPRYEVRSAGLAPFATTPVTRELLVWADRIFVMSERDDRHLSQLMLRFPDLRLDRRVVDLDIPDRWARGHRDLRQKLVRRLARHLGRPEGPA